MRKSLLAQTGWVLLGLVAGAGCGQSASDANGRFGGPQTTVVAKDSVLPASAVSNVTVNLQPGWNSAALQCQRVTMLSGSPSISGFAFFENGAYQTRTFTADELNAGTGGRRGLFIYSNGVSSTSFSYSGIDEAPDTVDLLNGYNLVSFTTNADVPGSTLVLPANVLSTFQQINADNSMTPVDVAAGGVLRAGRPYWVFSNGPARLTRKGPSASPTASPSAPVAAGPVLTGLSPNSGWTGGTSGVTLTGTGFRGATQVTFGGVPVLFTVLSDTQLLADAPPQTFIQPPATVIDVQVKTPGGVSPVGSQATWTYTTAGPPPTTGGGGGGGGGGGPSNGVFLGSNGLTVTPGSATLSVETTTATATGDIIVIWLAMNGSVFGSGTVSVAPAGAAFTNVYANGLFGARLNSCFLAKTTQPVPAGSTITVTPSALAVAGDVAVMTVYAFSSSFAGTLDTVSVDTGSTPVSQPPTPTVGPTATTTVASTLGLNSFVVVDGAGTASPTFTAGAGWTALTRVTQDTGTRCVGLYPQFQVLTATGQYTGTCTLSSSQSYMGAVVGIR